MALVNLINKAQPSTPKVHNHRPGKLSANRELLPATLVIGSLSFSPVDVACVVFVDAPFRAGVPPKIVWNGAHDHK